MFLLRPLSCRSVARPRAVRAQDHDHEEPDKVLREALEEQCSVWRARKAPMLAGLFEAILDEFERNPPACVVVNVAVDLQLRVW